jgi:hypothetical protein
MKSTLTIAALVTIVLSTTASAADSCKAVAIRDVPAIEEPSSIWHKGQVGMVTGFSKGVAFQHGGYSYRASALRLLNCIRIGDDVVLDTRKNSRKTLTSDHIDDRLLEAGLCSACAGNAAELYASGHAPAKYRALIKRAMTGDQRAVDTLNNDNALIEGRVK